MTIKRFEISIQFFTKKIYLFIIIPDEANIAKRWILKNIYIKTFVLVLNIL